MKCVFKPRFFFDRLRPKQALDDHDLPLIHTKNIFPVLVLMHELQQTQANAKKLFDVCSCALAAADRYSTIVQQPHYCT